MDIPVEIVQQHANLYSHQGWERVGDHSYTLTQVRSDQQLGAYVGCLRENWDLPSDHLPIGITLQSSSPFHIALWNILNNAYMENIYFDYQGLNQSLITAEDQPVFEKFTKRDGHIIELILGMIRDEVRPRSLIVLQECGEAFLQHLEAKLPPHMKLVRSFEYQVIDQEVVLYDQRLFDCIEKDIALGLFSSSPKRAIMNLLFEDKGTKEHYRIISAHLPWMPEDPAPAQFAAYLAGQKASNDPRETVIAMGDMNRRERDIAKIFAKSGFNDFQQISPYCTYILYQTDPSVQMYMTGCLDHAFIFGKTKALADAPEHVLPGLDALVDRLHGYLDK